MILIDMHNNNSSENTWAMLSHLGTLLVFVGVPFAHLLIPFLIRLFKKNESQFIEEHTRESLNFQLSFTIYLIGSAILIIIAIGYLLLVLLALGGIYFILKASYAAYNGEKFKYPYTIQFIK